MQFVIVTGMSGAGKSQAIKWLEDLGFFCIDNLPPALIPKVADLCAQSEKHIDRVGLVIDVREQQFLSPLLGILADLRREGHRVQIVFLEAGDDVLVRRFSESRRPHPLAGAGSVAEGIRTERGLLEQLQAEADLVIDTSHFTVHEFRKLLATSFLEVPRASGTILSIVSFGYKYGLPVDADLIFDVRMLPNPFFVDTLRPLPGHDPRIREYLLGFPETREFLEHLEAFLGFSLPLYVQQGKAYLTLAVGCTGGRHRSVAVAEYVAERLRRRGYEVTPRHRDVDKGGEGEG